MKLEPSIVKILMHPTDDQMIIKIHEIAHNSTFNVVKISFNNLYVHIQ